MIIPYGRQSISEDDIEAVVGALRSDFLTQGPIVPAFENAVSSQVGVGFSVAVNSATSALHIACMALGLGPGDRLWTSPITFVASANCGRYCGADIDFVDIDAETFNMCPDAFERKLDEASRSGKLPSVVIPVHMCGQSPDMKRIFNSARSYGVRVIEDASHAIGADYNNEPVGGCRYSDITVFSFHPVKIITSAEGGIATTKDSVLADRMRLLRSHGVTKNSAEMVQNPDGPWSYEQHYLGWNYRMTELQAALGLSQSKRLGEFIARRRQLASSYDEMLHEMPIILPGRMPGAASSWHLYVIRVKDPSQRRDLYESLSGAGIGVNVHYIPVHLQPYYRALGFKLGDFPIAEDYYSRAISIPLYAGMTNEDQVRVVSALSDVLC